MLTDITGIVLTPGNGGKDCLGSSPQVGNDGIEMEHCCGDCDYSRCCYEYDYPQNCYTCECMECPRIEEFANPRR